MRPSLRVLEHTHASYLERVYVLDPEKFGRVVMGKVLVRSRGKETVSQSPFGLELQTK